MRAAVAAAVSLVVLLAVSATADARIFVQRSIAGVPLHATKAKVRTQLGMPPKVRMGTNDFGKFTEWIYPRVTVSFQSGSRVTALRTTSRLERTGRHVGVGSTEARVAARVRGVICRTDSGFRHCFVGSFLPGRVVTDFRIRHGRVRSITIGFVLD